MISGPHTAPLARTVANSTMVTPNSRKFQVASSWMCRAIGSAGLSAPRNSAEHGAVGERQQHDQRAGDQQRLDDPERVIWPTRSQLPAPIFCAAIALTAAPSAIAGIWT